MMKKIFLLLVPAGILLACNNETGTISNTNSDTATSKTAVNLPYTVDRTPDWEMGDEANVAVAMNTLKAYEKNDMTSLAQYLADSVEFYSDGYAFKGTKDSLIKEMAKYRDGYD